MKKQLPTHDETPSTPIPSKKIETGAPITEGQVRAPKHADGEKGTPLPKKKMTTPVVNNEGEVRQSKTGGTYEVKEHTNTQPRSKSGDPYPLPDEDIDIYSVDTRIWDRLSGMGGDGGGPHTHDNYADKAHAHDTTHTHTEFSPVGHTHTEAPHDHDGSYAPAGHTHDITHNHTEYAPTAHAHDFTHEHTDLEDEITLLGQNVLGKWGMWSGTQAEYDALASYDDTTLYVVV